MPQKYVKIPPDIVFRDPITREATKEPFTFESFLFRLLDNPKWSQTYRTIKSADAIISAFRAAYDGVMVVAEEDWKNLKEAAETPKAMVVGASGHGQIVDGLGVHPRVAPQLLPFLEAVIGAADKDPRVNQS